jgi:hypothetical protein
MDGIYFKEDHNMGGKTLGNFKNKTQLNTNIMFIHKKVATEEFINI